jgi:hypothetical protein
MESEIRRLQATRGSASLPSRPSMLRALQDVLAHLPQNLRFRLLEIRLDESRLLLDGQARSHADVDAIATALRQGTGFEVEPPRSEQRDDAVSFALTAPIEPPDEPISQRKSRPSQGKMSLANRAP